MITLHRLNGQTVAINPDLVTWIDVTPDTTVTMLGGDRIMVRETLEEVIDAVIAYRASIRAVASTVDVSAPGPAVIEHARQLRHSVQPHSLDRAARTPSYAPARDSKPPDSTARSRGG